MVSRTEKRLSKIEQQIKEQGELLEKLVGLISAMANNQYLHIFPSYANIRKHE
jgi:hypothetical protein